MIQRKQTLYMLLAIVSMVACLCLPMGSSPGQDGMMSRVVYYNFGIYTPTSFVAHPLLFVDLVVAATLASVGIFLYKRRRAQMRVCVACIILTVLWYGLYAFSAMDIYGWRVSWGACLPLVSVLLLFLAYRGIKADDKLIKSVDRIR